MEEEEGYAIDGVVVKQFSDRDRAFEYQIRPSGELLDIVDLGSGPCYEPGDILEELFERAVELDRPLVVVIAPYSPGSK